jgi:hypothetical protein
MHYKAKLKHLVFAGEQLDRAESNVTLLIAIKANGISRKAKYHVAFTNLTTRGTTVS